MQNLNFTPRLLRQRRFLSFLLPLFALFAGLGSSQSAMAANVLSNSTVYIGRNGGANETFNANPSTPNPFTGARLGTYDINNGQIVLQGGSITSTLSGTSTATSAQMNYTVTDSLGNVKSSGTINLSSIVTSGNVRTFSFSTANIDLLNGITNADSGYALSVDYVVRGFNPASVRDDNGYTAFFNVTGVPIAPTSLGNSNVFIDQTSNQATPSNTGTNITYGGSSGRTPLFQGANLGIYDINTGQLKINGGDATTVESNGDAVQTVRLIYQIVKPVQPANGVSPATTTAKVFPISIIGLTQLGTATTSNGATTRLFSNGSAFYSLIAGLANSGTGTYNITVRYEADVLRNGSIITLNDPSMGGYTANFSTVGIPILTDTWTGAVNDDWFNAGNWDLKIVPTSNINVVVPDFGTGNAKPYPNIYAGAIYFATNAVTVDNTNSGPAMCRDLDMKGSTQALRTITRLQKGRLQVFGNFINTFDSYIQAAGTVIEFAGSGNQTITGGTFVKIEMSGGGTKALTGVMTVTVSLEFLANGGLMTTDISKPDKNYVTLGARSTDAPDGAQLIGETDATTIPSFIRGFVRTTRTNVLAQEKDVNGNPDPRTFGNIGMTLYFTGSASPGDVDVTRNTAESYTPLVGPNGGTARYGIRRIFGVRPSVRLGVVATLTFAYLDGELVNLGPANPPVGFVPEPNLALFVSQSGGNQFGYLGRDALDQVNNILTKLDVRVFATFTLGDKNNPLPVSLTGFDAKRIGADALVTWQTASEQNNKGFNVQVSADGKTYRTIGFVATETINSNSPKAYTFTDTEKNKAGARYYRLEQLDVDGKSTFYAPRVVTFDGKAAETSSSIVAYPNPLNNEILHLSLNSSVSGTAVVRILDMTGRQVAQRNLAITIGSNDVAVENMSELKSGLYILNVMLPSGEKKTMKVVKQ